MKNVKNAKHTKDRKKEIATFLSEMTTMLDQIDLEILVAEAIGKFREFVLASPNYELTEKEEIKLENFIKRRSKGEPIAYIVGHKEFYGLDFKVNKHTLIPRPETEMIVDEVLKSEYLSPLCHPGKQIFSPSQRRIRKSFVRDPELPQSSGSRISDFSSVHTLQEKSTFRDDILIIDIGTGSGNIIISIAKNIQLKNQIKFFATDISSEALKIAKQNAKKHNVNKKIEFVYGDLLKVIRKDRSRTNDFLLAHTSRKKSIFRDDIRSIIITANLPYLSAKIYNSTPKDVKNFEPKSALYSAKAGLAHYEKLFKQIISLNTHNILATIIVEISPEQKIAMKELGKKYFPDAVITFQKDLAGKWRICTIKQQNE